MQYLKQSTAVTLRFGPFLDEDDGKTAETGLTISQADVRLSKEGGAFAQKNDATAGTHDENGWYSIPLNATDTNTAGTLDLAIHESGALPVFKEFMVVPANVFDSLIDGTDKLQTDAQEIEGGNAKIEIAKSLMDQNVKAQLQSMLHGSVLDFMYPRIADGFQEASGPTSQKFEYIKDGGFFRAGMELTVIFTDLESTATYINQPIRTGWEFLGSFIFNTQGTGDFGVHQIVGGYCVDYNAGSERIIPNTKFGVCQDMPEEDWFVDQAATGNWDGKTDITGEPNRSEGGWTFIVKTPSDAPLPTSNDALEIRSVAGGFGLNWQRLDEIKSIVSGKGKDGKVLYVDNYESTAIEDGKSWETAFDTISEATAQAESGDIIYVRSSSEQVSDPTGYAENVLVPKGVTLIGVIGTDGAGTSTSRTNIRIIGDPATLNAPVLEIGEGAVVRNVRIEAFTGARIANIVKMHNWSRLEEFDLGGVSNGSSVYWLEMVSGQDHIIVDSGHIGCTNVNNTAVLMAANLCYMRNVTFDQAPTQDYVDISGGWNRLSKCSFAGVDSGKVAVNVTGNYNEVVWNTWAGAGSFSADSGTENVIQNNGTLGSGDDFVEDADGRTYFVDWTNGDDANSGDRDNPLKTISGAFGQVQNGDTIIVVDYTNQTAALGTCTKNINFIWRTDNVYVDAAEGSASTLTFTKPCRLIGLNASNKDGLHTVKVSGDTEFINCKIDQEAGDQGYIEVDIGDIKTLRFRDCHIRLLFKSGSGTHDPDMIFEDTTIDTWFSGTSDADYLTFIRSVVGGSNAISSNAGDKYVFESSVITPAVDLTQGAGSAPVIIYRSRFNGNLTLGTLAILDNVQLQGNLISNGLGKFSNVRVAGTFQPGAGDIYNECAFNGESAFSGSPNDIKYIKCYFTGSVAPDANADNLDFFDCLIGGNLDCSAGIDKLTVKKTAVRGNIDISNCTNAYLGDVQYTALTGVPTKSGFLARKWDSPDLISNRFSISYDFITFSKAIMIFKDEDAPLSVLGSGDYWQYVYTEAGGKPTNSSEIAKCDRLTLYDDAVPS